jgi:hypothetical protein
MVTIEINEKVADLALNTSIDLSFKSPLADGVSAARSFSLPFKLASTPEMLTHLKNIHRLDTQVDSETLDAHLKLYDQLIEKGKYRIEKANSQYIDGHYESENRSFDVLLKETKIQALLPTIVIPKTNAAHWMFNIKFFSTMVGNYYSLHINGTNISYTAQSWDNPISIAQYFSQKLNQDFGINANSGSGRLNIFPTNQQVVRILPWLSTNLELHSYSSFGQAQQDNFTEFISNCFDVPRRDISFGFMINSGLYEQKNGQWRGEINPMFRIDTNLYTPENPFFEVVDGVSAAQKGDWEFTYMPFLRIKYLIKLIANKIGIFKIQSNFEGFQEMMSDMIVYNTQPLDEVVEEWKLDFTNKIEVLKSANVGVSKIDLKNHIIDMTASEFLDQLCQTFNLTWDIKGDILFFSLLDSVLRNQPLENKLKVVPFTIDKSFKKREGFIFKFIKEDKDKSSFNGSYIEGQGKYEHLLPTGILKEFDYFNRKCCYSEQKSKDESVMRFMFDRGVQYTNLGNIEYIKTSIDNVNNAGNEQWQLSLIPQKLFNYAFREIMRLKANGFPITFKARIRLNDLSVMTKWQTIMYAVNSPEGSFVIGIEEAIVSADINGMKEVKITGIGRY